MGKKILLTAFEPFAGRKVNLSEVLIESVKEKLEQVKEDYKCISDLEIETLVLPVVYDKAALALINHYDNSQVKPQYVLSFGEGREKLTLETAARNLDSNQSIADNNGNIRVDQEIIPGGKEAYGFTMPMHLMYTAIAKQNRKTISISHTTGSYVCNNTAYRACLYFQDKAVKYGFIHTPASTKETKDTCDPEKNAQVVVKMLIEMFTRIEKENFIKSMPVDHKGAERAIKRFSERYREFEQYVDFFDRLALSYEIAGEVEEE